MTTDVAPDDPSPRGARRVPRSRGQRQAVTWAAVSIMVLTFGGCGNDLFGHVKTEHYDTSADAPASGDLAFVLPRFIPTDATDITVHVDTEVPDAKMYDWRSVSGQLPADCRPAAGPGSPAPFDTGAWPPEVGSATGWSCGARPTQLRTIADRYYAW